MQAALRSSSTNLLVSFRTDLCYFFTTQYWRLINGQTKMTAEKWLSGMDSLELPTEERIREVSMKSALDPVVPSPHSRENIRLLRVTRPIIIGFITNCIVCQEYALAPDSAPRLCV